MGKRRVLATLALSLLLHAGLLAWLISRPRVEPAGVKPTELVFVEVDLPPPPPPQVEEPPPPAPAPPPALPKVAKAAPLPPPVAVAKAEPVAAPEPPPEEPPSDRPVADSPRMDMPRLEVPRLAPSAGLTLSLDAGFVAEEEPRRGLHAPEISKDLVADLTRSTIGRGKVDRGLVHPYYQTLGKALLKNWDADRSVSAKGLKGFAESTVENTKAWNKIWLDKANEFGKSGTPFELTNNARNKPTNERLLPGQDLQARKEVQKEMAKQFKSSRRAEIKVTQALTGKLLKVELLKPSNDAFVDNQAVVDVRAAAEQLPPPPDEVIKGKTEIISTWEFELVVSITPPVPTFTFEFDEAIGFVDLRLPLDRRIYKKVRLLSVD